MTTPFPFIPLSADLTLPLSPLPPPPDPWSPSEFPQSLPGFRLNLLTTDNIHLFLAHSNSHFAVYQISRSRSLALHPLAALPLLRPTTINNARTIVTPDDNFLILLTGGHERPARPATLSYLQLPRNPDTNFWRDAFVHTRVFRDLSAWGLAVHAPTDRLAFSSNSRTITMLSPSTLLQDTCYHSQQIRTDAHTGNIPSVAFSPDGALLASASIDTTFAIFRVCARGHASAPALFRSQRPRLERWSDVASVRARCWMVHWVMTRMVGKVGEGDPVWGMCDRQREGTNLGGVAYSHKGEERESIFSGGAWGWGLWEREGEMLLYDDVEEEFMFVGGDSMDRGTVGGVGGANNDAIGFRIELEDDAGVGEEMADGERGDEPCDYRLLLVGRQSQLTLYRVSEAGNTEGLIEKTDKLAVEKLDSIELYREGSFSWTGWCSKAEELGSLGALALAVNGIGVIVIRIIKKREERLFVEHVLTRKRTEDEAFPSEFQMQIIGMCVVERGTVGECGYSVELWVVWQDAMVQCWEIWREGGLINSAVCV